MAKSMKREKQDKLKLDKDHLMKVSGGIGGVPNTKEMSGQPDGQVNNQPDNQMNNQEAGGTTSGVRTCPNCGRVLPSYMINCCCGW